MYKSCFSSNLGQTGWMELSWVAGSDFGIGFARNGPTDGSTNASIFLVITPTGEFRDIPVAISPIPRLKIHTPDPI